MFKSGTMRKYQGFRLECKDDYNIPEEEMANHFCISAKITPWIYLWNHHESSLTYKESQSFKHLN